MALVSKSFSIDIVPGKNPPIIHVSEKDIGRLYHVSILNDGIPFSIPNDTTAKVEGTIGPYGFSENANVESNEVMFILRSNMTSIRGKVWTKIKLSNGNDTVSTCAFWLDVDRAGAVAGQYIDPPVGPDSGDDEGGSGIQPDWNQRDITAADYIKNNPNIVDVKRFGAKGDGSTDDTTAIQDAIDYALENNRVVYFSSGDYLISRPLVLNTKDISDSPGSRYWDGNGTILEGERLASVRIIKQSSSTYQSQNTYSDAKKQVIAETVWDSVLIGDGQATGHTIRNITLVNESSSTDAYTIVSWVSRMTIENVNSVSLSHGINLYSYFNRIENIRFNGLSDVLHIDDGTSTFISRTFVSGASNPYYIKSAYSVLSNMAADSCTGAIYQVGGAGVVMIGCGDESSNATNHIYCPVNDTELTVIGGMWYGQITSNSSFIALTRNRCKVTLLHPCIVIRSNVSYDRYLVHTSSSVNDIEFNCHDLSYYNANSYTFSEYIMADANPASGKFTMHGRPVDYRGNPLDWRMGSNGAEFWNGNEFVPAVFRTIQPTNYNINPTLGKRLNANGETEYASMWITDYIPCSAGDIVYGRLYLNDRLAQGVSMYNSERQLLKCVSFNNFTNSSYGVTYNGISESSSGINNFVIPIGTGSGWDARTAYIRLTGHNNLSSENCIFTVNETFSGITADFALRSEIPDVDNGPVVYIDIFDDGSMEYNGASINCDDVAAMSRSGKTVIGRFDPYLDESYLYDLYLTETNEQGGITFTGFVWKDNTWSICVADCDQGDVLEVAYIPVVDSTIFIYLNNDGSINRTSPATLSYTEVKNRLNRKIPTCLLVNQDETRTRIYSTEQMSTTTNSPIVFAGPIRHANGDITEAVFLLDSSNQLTVSYTARENAVHKVTNLADYYASEIYYPSVKGVWNTFQRKPVTVWEVPDATQGLSALNTNITANLAWQLTNLDLTPFKRIKIYSRAGRKTGAAAADSSITPASIIEMSLDDRAKETVRQNVFIGSSLVQNPNDANRLGLLTCAVSADKTKFAVVRATTLYGTAATSNTDAHPNVFMIEGYYD